MHEDRRLVAQRREKADVARRRGDPLVAAGDVRDLHRVVVDDVGQVVRGEAVRLQDHEVVEEAVLVRDLAADEVAEGRGALLWHPEAHHVRLARTGSTRSLRRVEVAVAPVVARGLARGALPLAHLAQLIRRAEAAIGVAAREQRSDGRVVALEPLRLHVGRERPADVGALVPVDAEPAQRALDALE